MLNFQETSWIRVTSDSGTPYHRGFENNDLMGDDNRSQKPEWVVWLAWIKLMAEKFPQSEEGIPQ